jgi:nicotinamide-nucleotide amidase
MMVSVDSGGELAARIVNVLGERRQTLATAESLTGGLLGAAITAIPGASNVYRGGIIAYATELKAVLLGVPGDVLARHGPVYPGVAAAMAAGARDRLGATWGLATTGVAGPDPVDELPPGTVHIAASAGPPAIRSLALTGRRDKVRRDTVEEALKLLWEQLREDAS